MDREYTIEIEQQAFLDAQASLAPTPVLPSSVGHTFGYHSVSVSEHSQSVETYRSRC